MAKDILKLPSPSINPLTNSRVKDFGSSCGPVRYKAGIIPEGLALGMGETTGSSLYFCINLSTNTPLDSSVYKDISLFIT